MYKNHLTQNLTSYFHIRCDFSPPFIVDECPVGRLEINDVGTHSAARRPVRSFVSYRSVLENSVLFGT